MPSWIRPFPTGRCTWYWPEAIGLAVDAVESAPFLSRAEKRDIFYGNAVRFLRLPPA